MVFQFLSHILPSPLHPFKNIPVNYLRIMLCPQIAGILQDSSDEAMCPGYLSIGVSNISHFLYGVNA